MPKWRKCLIDGTCDCGELEGQYCQKASTVSRQLIGRLGNGSLFALLLMVAFLVCLGVMAVLAMTMYKRRMMLFKKNEAASGSFGGSIVSFHGNVISFSNPVLDYQKPQNSTDQQPEIEYSPGEMQMQQPKASSPSKITTTTFSNPVYELTALSEKADLHGFGLSQPDPVASVSNDKSRSKLPTDQAVVVPELSFNVIAPHSEIVPLPPPQAQPRRRGEISNTTGNKIEDKSYLMGDQISDV